MGSREGIAWDRILGLRSKIPCLISGMQTRSFRKLTCFKLDFGSNLGYAWTVVSYNDVERAGILPDFVAGEMRIVERP